MHYLYKITNAINNKIYIGQTIDPTRRWHQHRRDAANPKVPLQYAIKKYGSHNFEYKIIASCKNQDDANELETLLVSQYESHISTGKGYNATHGGFNAPKSEEWKQSLKNWHSSLSIEEKATRSEKLRQATLNQIENKGHPGLGTKRTAEQKEKMSLTQQNRNLIYTDEMRKNMSDAHIGKKQPAELIKKRADSIRRNKGSMICEALDCGIEDRRHSSVIGGVRYCGTHAMRIKTNGTLKLLPRKANNKKEFTNEQINSILLDKRSAEAIGKDYSVSERVILRIRKEFNINTINIV